MMIPVLMVELNEAHATFCKAACLEAIGGKGAGRGDVQPYSSHADFGSPEISVTSGTLVCIEYAISY